MVRIMLTNNIDIADRLINGQLGTVMRINVDCNTQKPNVINVKFDDDKAGKNLLQKLNNQYANCSN